MTPAPHEVPYLASTRERLREEREEGRDGLGILIGLALGLPIWALIVAVVMWFVE